jgi:hypothetical protein
MRDAQPWQWITPDRYVAHRQQLMVALMLFLMLVLCPRLAPGSPSTDYVYFLDDFSAANVQNVPSGIAVIGETEATGSNARSVLTAGGRVVGTQTEFNDTSRITWTSGLHDLFNGTAPDLSTPQARQAFALQVLQQSGITTDAANQPGGGFPVGADEEWKPTPAGGYVLFTQDVEGPVGTPEATAAAITAVMWASRELLGPDMKIVPVPASALIKEKAADWNLKAALTGDGTDNYLSFLDLGGSLGTTDQTALDANEIDLFSLLHLASAEGHPLIDGILSQQYSIHDAAHPPGQVNCGAIPGSFSADTPAFYDDSLPYALMAAHDNPAQLFIDVNPNCASATPPWSSHYHETMPFLCGVYWSAAVDPAFDPADYLLPAVTVAMPPAACRADFTGDLTVDGSDLLELLSGWGAATPNTGVEITGDQSVDGHDLAVLIGAWGQRCFLEANVGSDWIAVLVAQNAPPVPLDEQQDYVDRIHQLAPNLEQIHLRYLAGRGDASLHQSFAHLIGLFREAYGSALEIGFHPDNSSCSPWGCSNKKGDCSPDNAAAWQCVLDASIIEMNAINALADPGHDGSGFNIFSIEQSYVENVGTSLAAIKHCLGGDGEALPGVTPAAPPVKFGSVLPSYGGPEIYGTDGYDYGYPQYYNLGKRLVETPEVMGLVTSGYFPTLSTPCVQENPTGRFNVVDNNVCGPYAPNIPCFEASSDPCARNIFNTDPTTGEAGVSAELAASYLGYLMTQYPPISNTVALGGSEVFITFSGEATTQFSFFGTEGWNLEALGDFKVQLDASFATLKKQAPGLFPSGGTAPADLRYAIWNFEAIIDQNPAP